MVIFSHTLSSAEMYFRLLLFIMTIKSIYSSSNVTLLYACFINITGIIQA